MDPNPIQSSQFQPNLTPQSPPPESKSNQGIPVLVLIPVLIIIIASIFIFPSLLSKKSSKNTISTNSPIQQRTTLPVTSTPTPTPTPRPTGPGQYACSTLGSCKDWDLKIQKENCTITFADRNCLDQCSDTTKRCKI